MLEDGDVLPFRSSLEVAKRRDEVLNDGDNEAGTTGKAAIGRIRTRRAERVTSIMIDRMKVFFISFLFVNSSFRAQWYLCPRFCSTSSVFSVTL